MVKDARFEQCTKQDQKQKEEQQGPDEQEHPYSKSQS